MSIATYTLTLPASPKGARPSRLPVLPGGGYISGKDGRAWYVQNPGEILRRLQGRTVVLDENHSTYLKAPTGDPAPALARMSAFSMQEDGSLWAEHVEWTKYGGETYDSGSYLGLSPAIIFDPSADPGEVLGNVIDIHSVAMVNDPNLPMPALNSSEIKMTEPKKTETTQAPVVPAAQETVKVLIEQTPPADLAAQIAAAVTAALKPIADEITAIKAAQTLPAIQAPAVVAPNAAQTHEVAVNAALEKYVSAGKVWPDQVSRDRFKARSNTPATLAEECAYYENAQPLVSLNAAHLVPPTAQSAAHATEDEARICKMFGREPKDLK